MVSQSTSVKWRRVRICVRFVILAVLFVIGLELSPSLFPPFSFSQRVSTLTSEITAPQIQTHIEHLVAIGPRPGTDPAATRATVDYIKAQLIEFGYEPQEEAVFWHGVAEGTVVNVIAELRGSKHPDLIVEIGAHYDTVPSSPGADDNASGVAGLLEVARILPRLSYEKTIRLCFFGLEEEGLIGSQAHVQHFQTDSTREVEGLLNLEMIACRKTLPDSQDAPIRIPIIASLPTTGDFIAVIGDFQSGTLGNMFEASARLYATDLKYFSANRIGGFFGDASRSDHSPYWEVDLPGIMLTDTAEFRNPNYHQPSDTLETLDLDFAALVTRAAAATMMHWAGLAKE